jgi:hypothetical protein
MQFITGQLASNERRYTQQRNTLVRQLQSETASRQQKLDAAKFLYDANRNSLADTITLYNATKPDNIGNIVDPVTGEMTVIMQNPVTGEVTRKNVGQVQTPARWTDNVKFAQDSGVNQPFFTKDGKTIINTNTGREYSTPEQFFADGGSKDFSGVQRINVADVKTKESEKQLVLDMAAKYADAGISPSDSLAVAQAKLAGSRIYREQVRPPASGGGGGGLTPYQTITGINAIQDNAKQDTDVAQFTGIRGAYEQARQAVAQGNSAGDIVLMRTLAKITDPTTGVREEEYKTFQSAIGTLPRLGVQATSNLVGKGQLTAKGREQLYKQVENIYNQREAAYLNKINFYQAEAKAIGGQIPFYTAPKLDPINFNQSAQQPASQGFWGKAVSWLFGK